MASKTGLLIISNPKQIDRILSSAKKEVSKVLYIQLLSALIEPLGCSKINLPLCLPTASKTINGIYSQAAKHCQHLDVRVLLSGLKQNFTPIQTKYPIEVVIFDKAYKKNDIDHFLSNRILNLAKNFKVHTIKSEMSGEETEKVETKENDKDNIIVKHGVMGGTFDRLHMAHKLLLTELVLRSKEKVTIGVTDDNMIQDKVLSELIEDYEVRAENVRNFIKEICPDIECIIEPISDPFGPSIVDSTMDLLLVSKETEKGGLKVNEVRKSKSLKELILLPMDLIDEPSPSPIEETKISSSTGRIRLLGTLLKPVLPNDNISKKPYVIGLTGGIASGKSGVSHWIKQHGALIIDCDMIGHGIYKFGKPCYQLLVDHFGTSILDSNNEIDRKKLGSIVFKDRNELEKLNNLVWPSMLTEVTEIISKAVEDVVVIDAAILLVAEWEKHCHEVWTTTVPKNEAVRRLVERNNLTEEQALQRVNSQPPPKSYVKAAHVVFCTLWPKEYTKQQVDRAWSLLRNRMDAR